MFESLLNNTFEEEGGSAGGKRGVGTAPNSNSGQPSQPGGVGEAMYLQQQQQRQQQQQQSGTPSPSPSEYDTACDPWDDY